MLLPYPEAILDTFCKLIDLLFGNLQSLLASVCSLLMSILLLLGWVSVKVQERAFSSAKLFDALEYNLVGVLQR